jgi:hypothetical protein
MVVTESIFDGNTVVIPMAGVSYIEKVCTQICVVMRGAQHPLDAQGNLTAGYGRADCPYLKEDEAKAFLAAWCKYRAEVEGLIEP